MSRAILVSATSATLAPTRNPYPDTDADKILEDVMYELRAHVALGRRTFDQITRKVDGYVHSGLADYVPNSDHLPAQDSEEQRTWMLALLDAEFAAHLRAQESWDDPTDAERLTAAFAELDAAGILAREDYECCTRCAVSALVWEAKELGKERESNGEAPVRGYVYYHGQDTMSLRPMLGFSSVSASDGPEGPGNRATIGREVVEILRRHGLSPEWNGDPSTKVDGPSLARRRTGSLAEHPSRRS